MSNIRQFSSKDDLEEQACLWISRLDRGLSASEKQTLDAWVAASQAHRKALFDAASLWDDMSVLNELSGLFPQTKTKQDSGRVKRLVNQARWSVAAGFMLAVVGVSLIINHVIFQPDTSIAKTVEQIRTGVGEQKNVVLADGSELHVNTDSLLSVTYSNASRDIVLLKGEAHFEVAHDEGRPFTVTAGENRVTAVGTAFNMQYVDDQAFELVVTEGKVLVNDRFTPLADNESLFSDNSETARGLLMVAGEKAKVKGDVEARNNLTQTDIDDDLAWQKGMIVFKGEPLSAVLEEIGRYTPVRFSVQDPALKQRRVAGYFRVGDIDGLLSALKNSFNIEHQKLGESSILLSTAGSS
ncbi:FecR family protein [Alteromonas halophila]|uniref:Sensor n=1 Tax=Alteromonas halophila TaxID=516698 RepID=A0A918JET3_9ALTE|nr:FecR domain-containing protein [Alteromonas halophila]GGW74275.1 sensor [Alteromonas halophila]